MTDVFQSRLSTVGGFVGQKLIYSQDLDIPCVTVGNVNGEENSTYIFPPLLFNYRQTSLPFLNSDVVKFKV